MVHGYEAHERRARAESLRARRLGRDERYADPILGPLLRGHKITAAEAARRAADDHEGSPDA
jgi:hypothetical protein